jgi:hypothetical protein
MKFISSTRVALVVASTLLIGAGGCAATATDEADLIPESGEAASANAESFGAATGTNASLSAGGVEMLEPTAAVFVELPPLRQLSEARPIADPSMYQAIQEVTEEMQLRELAAVTTVEVASGRVDLNRIKQEGN